ncbi:MAG TPA: hypothetical protein VF831_01010 [Anaerolineales bacterium]
MRILYRLRQFWRTLPVKSDPRELEQAKIRLNSAQWELFERLQTGEKRHALVMLQRLLAQGEDQPDLLVATLLHDAGKLRYPLNPVERAMIVLAEAAVPARVRDWGSLPVDGFESLPRWRKAFVVAEHHASWGADLAHMAGASPLAETLIREHHHPQALSTVGEGSSLLQKLWAVDNQS